MNRIRSVLLTGAVVGTIGTVLYSYFEAEAGTPFTFEQLRELVREHWRSLANVWLSFYGISVLFFVSAATLGRVRNGPYLTPKEWALDFHYRLAANQYFSCLVLLFVLCSIGLFRRAGSLASALELAPFISLAVAGLVAWSVCSAMVLFRLPAAQPITERAARELPEPGLSVRPPEVERELQNLAALIEQQRPLIEATRDTAAALYDLGQTIHANLSVLSDRRQERSSDLSAENLQTAVGLLEDTIRELRVIRGSLETAEEARAGHHRTQTEGIDRSDLAQGSLETAEEARAGHHRTEGQGVDRSDLAQELQELEKLLGRLPSQMRAPR